MQDFQNFLIAKYVEAKMKMDSFLKNEKGEANIIAVILVLAIVIAIVVIFRKSITKMVNDLWTSINSSFKDATANDLSSPLAPK